MSHAERQLEGDRLAMVGWGGFIALGGLAWFLSERLQYSAEEGFVLWLMLVGLEGIFLGLALYTHYPHDSLLIWAGATTFLMSLAMLAALQGTISIAEGGALSVFFFGGLVLLWGLLHGKKMKPHQKELEPPG